VPGAPQARYGDLKITGHNRLYGGLASTRERFAKLRALFDAIPETIAPTFADPDFPVKGVNVELDKDKNLRVRFIDREVKLQFRYDGSEDVGRGVIVAEDWSYGAKEPVTLWSIGFNGTGETHLEKRDGATFNLHNETDCAEIVLTAVESSLARQPSR
jgi:hypothetical protein